VLIGLIQVAVPSSGAYLTEQRGLTEAQYGQVFIAQLIAAIAGALLAGPAIRRVTLKSMYLMALLCLMGSQLTLASTALMEPRFVQATLWVSLALFGFGFGFGGGPLNGLMAAAVPRRRDAAITALHFSAGAGLMTGPLLVRSLESRQLWMAAPMSLAIVVAVTIIVVLLVGTLNEPDARSMSAVGHTPSVNATSPSRTMHFWAMMAIVFTYAIVEASFSNWAVIYFTAERGLSSDAAAIALSAFWGALTLGRLLATALLGRVRPTILWLLLPPLMVLAYIAVSSEPGSLALVWIFGLAGFACSAFFPLAVSAASTPYPQHTSWIASMLTASLMMGVGAATYLIGVLMQQHDLATVYRACALVPVLLLVLMYTVLRQSPPARK
jgi:FHS family glucose/mannose:H+ symporter-like MFS transporter